MEKFKAAYLTSAVDERGFLKTDKKIIAVAGKSNVGKSSLINYLSGQKKLARTSVTPGRTRMINYFDFGSFILADLPGYGFAKVSKEEKEKWSILMETFFETTNISHVLSLVDFRHDPTGDDLQMLSFLYGSMLPFTIVATKADKLGKSAIKPQTAKLAASLKVAPANISVISAETGFGGDDLIKKLKNIANS